MSLIPPEIRHRLDDANKAMGEMNEKLDQVVALLGEILSELRRQQ